MDDRRKQIPISCAVNIAIISELSNTEVFTKACIEVPLKYGIIPPQQNMPWPFFNISWGAYMMYSFFVVSKELYNLQNNDEFFQNLIMKNALQDLIFQKKNILLVSSHYIILKVLEMQFLMLIIELMIII